MKKTILTTLFVAASAAGVFGQGQVIFNNRITTDPVPANNLYAPVFDINPANPTQILTGQPNASGPGGAPNPVGSTDYAGRALLSGTGFTAQLWGGPVGTPEAGLMLGTQAGTPSGTATTTFRTGAATVGSVVIASAAGVAIPNAPSGTGSRAALQLRAWNNMGGTVTSWAMVLARPDVARGASPIFTPDRDLGGGIVTPPNLIGLQSFGLFTVVPEPSTYALAALGVAGLLLRRFRK